MVQTDVSQLSGECNAWRETLRTYRDEFSHDKVRLQKAAAHALTKDQLQAVEHLQNQFHIQLINIHDLEQAIKMHDRKMNLELSAASPEQQDALLAEHEELYGQYQSLEHTLQELRSEFDQFLNRSLS
jgi:ABC-type phosphate transport system auxiliary subunit